MQYTRKILDKKYQRDDLSKIVSNSKHLNDNEQSILCDVLNKNEFLFEGTLGTHKDETCKYRTTARRKTLS